MHACSAFIHIRHAMLVMLYFVLGEEKPVLAL